MDLPNKSDIPAPSEPAPKKHIEPVISGASKTPRPVTRRFFDFIFVSSPKELAKKVVVNTLVPRAKAAAEESFNGFLHGMLWGAGAPPQSQLVQGNVLRGTAQVYHNASNVPVTALQAAQQNISATRSSGNYEDVVCATQMDAETLLAQMYSTMNQYRVVAVADLYEMARIPTAPSDNAYGWLSLDGARIVKDARGYILELPKPKLI